MLPAAIFLVSFSKPILLLLRHEYLGATNLLSTLVVACMVFGLANLFLSSLYATGKTKLSRNIWIVSAIFFLFIAPLLIKTYSSQGLALAYLISSFFIFCLSYHFIKKVLSLELQWKNLLKLVCSSIIFLLFLLFSDILEASLLIKILVALSGVIAYLVVLLPLRFYTQQDIRLLEFITTKVPILKKQILTLTKFISKWLEPKQN
jgi:O-antigen/teichoic acid export membrane protein